MGYEQNRKETPLAKLFLSFLRLGATAFGGPTMVAYIQEMSVKRYRWISVDEFKRGVALCQSIPGATAMQMAAYVGLIKRGLPGAVATFSGFGLPAFVFMLFLSWLYTIFGNLPVVTSLLKGLQVIVVAIVANATYIFAKDTMKIYLSLIIAILSASAFWFGISPFFIIIGAALTGIIGIKFNNDPFLSEKGGHNNSQFYSFLYPVAFTVLGTAILFGINRRLFELAIIMLKIDLFAFGGGFAALPLMLQEIVHVRSWIDNKTFMDGIALGQVTPGPIIITATFVGFLTNGIAGSIVATLSIFIPSFTMLILGANIFNMLKQSVYFQAAIKGIFASFVGLLIFVTFKFAFAVSWDVIKVIICLCAVGALLKKIDIIYIVLTGAMVSVLLL
ncbi:MAG: chromate efflux transporter [Syntrophorhabdales bacterium]|nr:chromate efflux transporter [Syntrophorhabdales bacterium]